MMEFFVQVIVALGVWFIAYLFLGKELRRRVTARPSLRVHPRSVVDENRIEALKPLTVVSSRHFEVFYSTLGDHAVTYRNVKNNEIFFVLYGKARAQVYAADTNELIIEKTMLAHGSTADGTGEDIVAHSLEGQYIVLTGAVPNTRILCIVVPPYEEMMHIIGTIERGNGAA